MKQPISIWIDAREFTSFGTTGIARYLENLFVPFLEEHWQGTCGLLCAQPESVPPGLSRQSDMAVLSSGPGWWQDAVEIPRTLKTHHADIYFSPYYKTVFGGFFRRIVTVHDILFLRRRDVPAWRRMLIRHRLGRCVKKADMVLVDSGHTRSDVHRLLPGSEEKTVILYPDLGAAWQESVPDCLAKEIRTRYQRPYFLYVGNFNPHKNVQLLLEAFAEFRREEPHAEHLLLLVGGAKEVAAPWISGHGLDSHVEVLSHVSDQELRALYGCASWFITASAYEGFGYPVVEAMQSGCPVICAPETSLSEVSGNICVPVRTLDRAGIVRAIHRAVHMTAGEREDMVDQGRKHVQQFAPGTAAQRLMACLASAHFPMP